MVPVEDHAAYKGRDARHSARHTDAAERYEAEVLGAMLNPHHCDVCNGRSSEKKVLKGQADNAADTD